MRKRKIFSRNFVELTGAIHIHTDHSFDSETAVDGIIKDAKKYKIDYLMITDHNDIGCRKEESVINSDSPKVIVGVEVNDEELNNHLLVFNSDEVCTNCDAEQYVNKYHNEKAISFIAHPRERRRCTSYRKFECTLDDLSCVDGIEVWNFLSCWLGKLRPAINGIWMVLFPFFFVRKPHRENLKLWDKNNRDGKRKSGIGSIDAHSTPYSIGAITLNILPHKLLMRSIRTNILLKENKEVTNKSILEALKNGNSYIVNYRRGIPYNFYAGISTSNGNEAIFGEEIPLQDGLKFYFRLPKISRVDLFHNGNRIAVTRDEKGYFEIKEKGAYRLEISRFYYGWIYTNNIYVV